MNFLKRTLGILFAGMLLFITTACSNPSTSASTKAVPQRSTSNVERTITDQVSRPSRPAAEVKRDAERITKQAREQQAKRTGDVRENAQRVLDSTSENAKRVGNQIENKASEAKNRLEDQANASLDSAETKAERALDKAENTVDDLS